MRDEIIEKLKEIVGGDPVLTEPSQTGGYLYDESEIFVRPAASGDVVVVKPESADEISRIIALANSFLIPVYIRGGGTGLCGGSIPVSPGILLTLERMNKKIEIDGENLMATVSAGVTLGTLLEALEANPNLFFPIHPGDEGAQIGGMAATNAGGSRAIKHGIMRNQVKGLTVVLPTGEIVNMGGKLLKNNAGYDLMHLLIGSEGTLGVITEVVLKLYGKGGGTITMIVSFDETEAAASAVPDIMKRGIIPLPPSISSERRPSTARRIWA